jgi:hypothetical protein
VWWSLFWVKVASQGEDAPSGHSRASLKMRQTPRNGPYAGNFSWGYANIGDTKKSTARRSGRPGASRDRPERNPSRS